MDELVLVEQCVNLINGPLIFLQLLHLSIPAYTKQIFENFVFCSVRHLLLRIAIYHRAIGGLGIAGVRVLCISFPYFVIRVGANKLVKCTCGLTCFLSLSFAIANYVEMFTLAPEIIVWLFNEDRFMEVRVITDFLSKSIVQYITSISCLIFNAAEFLCYMILIVEMYKHHKRHVKLCLQHKAKLAKLKKRRNTVCTLGHFISWSVEGLIFGFASYIQVTSKKTTVLAAQNLVYFQILVPCINFVIFPTVQALTSEDLRDHICNFDWFRDTFLCIYGKLKQKGYSTGGESAHDIELQTLDNNCASNVKTWSQTDSACSLFENRTKSCIFHHEITAGITPRCGNLSKSFSL